MLRRSRFTASGLFLTLKLSRSSVTFWNPAYQFAKRKTNVDRQNMKITRITLENIRCFSGVNTLVISRGINLFVGQNSSGKSTILRCIGFNQGLASGIDVRRIGVAHGEILLEFDELDECASPFKINAPPASFRPAIKNEFHKQDKTYVGVVSGNGWQIVNQARFASTEPGYLFYPYLASRKPHMYSDEVNQEKVASIRVTNENLYAKINEVANSKRLKQAFSDACLKILGHNIETFSSTRGVTAGLTALDSAKIPLSEMGEGTAQILGLLVGLIGARGKIFLIEELENDIHPAALKALLEVIAECSKDNQFFISTHSNIVTLRLGAEVGSKIFKVHQAKPFDVPTSEIIEVGDDSQGRHNLLQELGYDFSDFGLYHAFLILEESSAESIINGILIPFFVPGLAGKLRTVSAMGVDRCTVLLDNFKNLFVFTHLSEMYAHRCWVLLDGDEAGQRVRSAFWGAPRYEKYRDNVSCLQQAQFEKYLPERFQTSAAEVLMKEFPEINGSKRKLILEVLDWAKGNPDLAKTEFAESAKEVIDYLLDIERALAQDAPLSA